MASEIKPFVPDSYRKIDKSALVFNPEQGKIYHYTRYRIEVIRLAKPYPAAYSKILKNNNWQCDMPYKPFPFLFTPPNLRNLESPVYAIRKNALHKATIYKNIVAYVGKEQVDLLNRFPDRYWFLYCLLIRGGNYAFELMQSNPALGYLLGAHAIFHPLKSKKYWQSAMRLVKIKRKDILAYFGFPACETMVKTFAKIKPQKLNTNLYFILRTSLQNNPALLRQLSFFPVHNAYSIVLVCRREEKMISYNCIAEIATMNEEEVVDISRLINDINRMYAICETNGIPIKKPNLKNITEIKTVHDELVNQIIKLKQITHTQFPAGIAKDIKCDTLWIEHIHNSVELYIEGEEMHHCIYSYLYDISDSFSYAAKMLYPERLTILYRRTRFGLELVDARGKFNALPANESFYLINLWLQGNFAEQTALPEEKSLSS